MRSVTAGGACVAGPLDRRRRDPRRICRSWLPCSSPPPRSTASTWDTGSTAHNASATKGTSINRDVGRGRVSLLVTSREGGCKWGWKTSVQLRLSIALVALACVVMACAQNVTPVIPEPTLRPDDRARNVMPQPSPKPDDKPAIALDCSGLMQGWNNCMLTASNTCGSRGYTILDRSDQNPTLPNESMFTRSMHIRCNS